MELDLVIKGLKHFKKIVHPKTDFITFQNVSDTEVDIILSSKSLDDPQFKIHAFREKDDFTDCNGKINFYDYFEISFLENGEWIDMWASYNEEDPLHEARHQLSELIELSSSEDEEEEEEEQEENYYDDEHEEDDEHIMAPKKRRTTE